MYITENEIKIEKNKPYVQIIVKGDKEPWVGGINGVFYRISRGVKVNVPVNLARLISLNEQVTVLGQVNVEEYKKGSGKCLNGRSK